MKNIILEFEESNKIEFTPHYMIYNKSVYECDWHGPDESSPSCGCVGLGRYCFSAQDPGGDAIEVLNEDLRQICAWEYASSKEVGNPELWWNYFSKVNENCGTYSKLNIVCSEEQMKEIDENMWNYVETCVKNSGGDDGFNSILEKEVSLRQNGKGYSITPGVIALLFSICCPIYAYACNFDRMRPITHRALHKTENCGEQRFVCCRHEWSLCYLPFRSSGHLRTSGLYLWIFSGRHSTGNMKFCFFLLNFCSRIILLKKA